MLSGGRKCSSAVQNVSKYVHVRRAISCRYVASVADAAARRFGARRLKAYAIHGAHIQRTRIGAATRIAAGRTLPTTTMTTSASSGLAFVPLKNARSRTGPARAALAA